MRASVASITKKFISIFFAATLALGLVPAAAFAVDDGAAAPKNSEATEAASIQTENNVISSEADEVGADEKTALIEENEAEGLTTSWAEDQATVIPAASERINETMTLQTRTVAQAESTRSYFLAQTLESTRTVPIVSANLPLDTSSVDAVADDNEASQEEEGDGSEDDPEADDSVGASFSLRTDGSEPETGGNGIALSSTVVGSFTYNGITYAVEPGGETVAVVAADYTQLPAEFIENQVIVLPSIATADGFDYYTVSRIADGAFASLNKENANPDFKGCEVLFSNEELLVEAEIDAAEVDPFLNPESDMLDLDGDGEADTPANPLKDCTGILALGISASITSIGDEAIAGFDTLQYLVVSEDNPTYASYDGALYDADLTDIRLIPEGRVGAVRVAPSAAEVNPEVFSHCPSVTTLAADPEGMLYPSVEEVTPALFSRALNQMLDSHVVLGLTSSSEGEDSVGLFNLEYNPTNELITSLQSRISVAAYERTDGWKLYVLAPNNKYIYRSLYKWDTTAKDWVRTSEGIQKKDSSREKPYAAAYEISTHDSNPTNKTGNLRAAGYVMMPLEEYLNEAMTKTNQYRYRFATTSGMDKVTSAVVHWTDSDTGRRIYEWDLGAGAVDDFTCGTGNGAFILFLNGAEKRTLSFYGNGGTASDSSVSGTAGSRVTLPTATRPGYSCKGWYTAASGGTLLGASGAEVYLPTASPFNGVLGYTDSYYAQWEPSTYTVQYNGNGGKISGTNATTSTSSHTYGTAKNLSANPFNVPPTGKHFKNWNTKADGSGTSYTETQSVISLTDVDKGTFNLYAIWDNNVCTVKYDANKGTGTMSNSTHTYGTTSSLRMNSFTAPIGKRFKNWNTKADGTGTTYTNGQIMTDHTQGHNTTLTLYAQWEWSTYTVTLNANGGKNGTASVTATYGSAMPTTNVVMPTKEYHTFAGYYDATTGGNMYYTAAGKSNKNWDKADNATLYARWTPNTYTITYQMNGRGAAPSGDANTKYTYGTAKTLQDPAAVTGYTFGGWYKEKECTNKASITASTFGNQTVWAKWTPNDYTVTLNANGGKNGTASVTATYEAVMPTDKVVMPTKDGYNFAGYYDTDADEGGTQYYTATGGSARTWNKASTATLYARWTKIGTYEIELTDPTLDKASKPIWYWPENGYVVGSADSITVVTKVSAMPRDDDYEFLGYFDGTGDAATKMIDADGTILAGEQTTNATWHAQWKRVSCPIELVAAYDDFTVDKKGTESIPHAKFDKALSESFTGDITPPVRKGYTFLGYWTAKNDLSKAQADANEFAGTQWINGDGQLLGTWVEPEGLADKAGVTLYAAWRLDECTVTFDLSTPDNTEQVDGEIPSRTWYYNMTLPETLPTPSEFTFSRNGYQFKGWYYEEAGTDGKPVERFVSNADGTRAFEKWDRDYGVLTLKAKWDANSYILRFNEAYPPIEGLETPESPVYEKPIRYDGVFDVADPTYAPYVFKGWYLKNQPEVAVADTHTTIYEDGKVRFTPQGDLTLQTSPPAVIDVVATWDAPEDATYHLYSWVPGTADPNISVTSATYPYNKPVPLGLETYPAAVVGWEPGGWVEVKPTTDESGDARARALIREGGPKQDAVTTSSFGPGVSEEKFFVFKWTALPFSVSFKCAPDDEADDSYVKSTDVFDNAESYDENILSWEQACAATKTGDWAHATHLPYDVTLGTFALPTVKRKGYDFVGWEQVSPEETEVALPIDPKEVAKRSPLHKLVFAPKFEESTYTIIFEPGAEGREEKTETVLYNGELSFPYPDALVTGSCFSSWRAETGETYLVDLKTYPVAEQADGSFALSDLDPDGDKVITFTGVWIPICSVAVPIQVTTMAIDTDTGDMVAAKSTLEPRYEGYTYEVLSLRAEPWLDDDGHAPFSGVDEGSVSLSVYAGLPEPADEAHLLSKRNVLEGGTLSFADKANTLRSASPLLVKLGEDAVTYINKSVTQGSDAPSLDKATNATEGYGFRAFTYENPLVIRYGLVFDGVSPKAFDYVENAGRWTLPHKDAGNTDTSNGKQLGWSSKTQPLAELCYTVRMAD